MTRFYDKVGYGLPGELVDGVWQDTIVERAHYGSVLEATRYFGDDEQVNQDVRLQNRIDIVADAFALENFSLIKYVSWMGTRWKASAVRLARPRLIITLSEVYNGPGPT